MNNTNSDNTQEQPSIITVIKKILSDFNTKLIFILVSLFILCYAFIMGVIDKYIANGILLGFNDNIAERILFILAVIALIYYTVIDMLNNKKVSSSRLEWACTILLFWAYYRLFSNEWIYLRFWNFKYLSYIDIIPLYSLSIVIKTACCKRVPREIDVSKGFETDLPIKEENNDSLIKRDNIAKELAIKIKNTPIEEGAFSIGIESPWGDGKTSFLYLLCNHFDKKDTIIIKFNPWDYGKECNLVDAFFIEFREALKEFDSSLSTNLTEYAHILSDSNHDIIKFSAKFIECFSSQSVEAKRKAINSAIKGINKLILVIIDDLDRLDKDEIISVLKLIRNTANFSNMVFVSAYDREYLVETLKDDVCNSNKYLEKIFQYQFKLPEYDKLKLRDILIKEGEKFIDDSDKEVFKNMLGLDYPISHLQFNYILSNIDNIRDVYRFLNSLKFIYQRLHGEILIRDLMMIELLRMKYNYVYKLLSKDHNKYLYNQNNSLVLWNTDVDKTNSSRISHSNIFAAIGEKYQINGNDYKKIERLLKGMFKGDSVKIKAINNSYYIDRYFYYSILDFDISDKEFKAVMKLDYDKIKQYIDAWLSDKKGSYLSDLLESAEFSNAEEYKKIIRSIFYEGYKTGVVFLKVNSIYSVIIKSPLTPEENKTFIHKVFFENGVSVFVSKFINEIIYKSDKISNAIFTLEEYLNMSADMLNMACENKMPFKDIMTLYSCEPRSPFTSDIGKSSNLLSSQNKNANVIFTSYFKSNYKMILPEIILIIDNSVCIDDSLLEIWNGKQAFKSFINELFESNKEDKQLEEFVEFMNKYFAQESLAPIPFDFNYIKLDS